MIKTALAAAALAVPVALAAWPAWAQYKVVGRDGSVTYTDRPPSDAEARVTPLGRGGTAAAASADTTLPAELRQPVQRYPVVLYASADCAPCDTGRRLLQQRGIPYSERRIATEDDVAALERVAGGRTVPALTIGTQALRGFSETDWGAYLDAAGYPRQSRLPANWQQPVAQAMTERAELQPQPRTSPAPAAALPRAAEPEPAASGVRF